MAGVFELKATKDGQFMFNLLAGNGQVILTSEHYKARDSAMNGIASVRENAAYDTHFDRLQASDGSPYFVLKAANAQVIGRSEMYSSAAAMENGIESVKSTAPSATTEDTTAA
jgi:uncharacterized protein